MRTITDSRSFLHEYFVPYHGNWNLTWVIQRYLKTAKPGLTPYKSCNAAIALKEMILGEIQVRSRPVILRIETTNLCNLHCPRCSCGINSDPRKKGFMTLDDYRLVLEENRRNAIIVRLDGNGEPMLHPEIFEMIKIAKSYGYIVSMSSNLNTDLSSDAGSLIDSELDRLVISVDGNTQESYEKYRVGGDLSLVEERLLKLLHMRQKLKSKRPYTEIQFLDWGYNHDEIGEIRRKVRRWGADKFEVISPDWAVSNAKANPKKPKRCFWLWGVLTVDWELNYHSCTNAWTLQWPRLNMKDIPSSDFWNHYSMLEARKYNLSKSSDFIASDTGCHCNNCSDMLVVNRPPGYICE
jgi:organic radical activating enzyme